MDSTSNYQVRLSMGFYVKEAHIFVCFDLEMDFYQVTYEMPWRMKCLLRLSVNKDAFLMLRGSVCISVCCLKWTEWP